MGPRLPQAIGGVPVLAWIFIAIAAGRLWMLIVTSGLGSTLEPLGVGGLATTIVGSLAVLLLPAFLLLRHPDAQRIAPVLTLGVVLVAVGEVLGALGAGLLPFLATLAADPEVPSLQPAVLAYSIGVELATVIGLAGVGLGLRRARRFRSHRATRWTPFILLFAALLVSSRAAEFMRLDPIATAYYPLYPGSIYVLSALTILAWAYLTITAVQGLLAHEEPRLGWQLGVVAGGLALASYQVFAVMVVVVMPNADLDSMLFLASGIFAAGPLALLMAFGAGLPSFAPTESAAS